MEEIPTMAKESLKKRAGEADEIVTMEKGHGELIRLGDRVVLRATLEPGWHWAEHVKPTAGTESCRIEHLFYAISGRMRVRLDSGEEWVIEPGDLAYLAPGHDARVEGDEPFVMLDFIGGENIASALKEHRKAA